MRDLIDRNKALSFPFANGKYDHKHADEHFIAGCEAYKEWLETLPSVEPERKKGKWANDVIGVLRCSECKTQAPWKYGRDYIDYRWKANYCPNCGADMREKE